MYKQCKNERSRQRIAHIAQCLLEMMETERYSQITVSALCTKACIPRKAFYRYFDTKEDVFHLLVDQIMAQCVAFCSLGIHNSTQVTSQRLELCYRFWLEHRSFLDLISQSGLQAALMMRTFQLNGIVPESSLSSFATDHQMKSLFSVTGIFAMIMRWHASGFDRTPAQMAQLTIELLSVSLLDQGERKLSQM